MFFRRDETRPPFRKRSGPAADLSFSEEQAVGGGMFTRRALLLLAVQTGVMGMLAHHLYEMQVVHGDELKEQARRNRTSRRQIAPARGEIYDRCGVLLAGNRPNWRALVMTEETTDLQAVVDRFATIVPLDERDRARIEHDRKHIRRYVPLTLKEFLSWDDVARLGLNAPTLPGVLIDVGTTREYPFKELLSHIIGYVAPPNEADVQRDGIMALPGMKVGRAGLEQTQESHLRGQPGTVEMEVNAHGRVMGELERVEGQPGSRVELTLDTVLQTRIRDRIGERVASAVVMDCRNGEVMGLVSTPSFDPTLFDGGISRTQWNSLITDQRTPLVDKAVSGLYPPGSTFKPAVALAALKAHAITPSDHFSCPGYYDMGGVRFHCWSRYGHGSINLHQALKYSCDVYFYQVARRCGMESIHEAAAILGLDGSLPIELPHMRAGSVPTPEMRRRHGHHWNGGDTVNAGIGQGLVQTTPLALATYVSRLATGRVVQPHLLRSVSGREIVPAPEPLPFAREALAAARGGMFAVVNEPQGTAPAARLNLPGVQMAGKTGSAQVRNVPRALRESGHFNSMNLPWQYRPHALFICFAPYDNPRYAVSVVVEHGNAGATEAAPLAAQIMTDTLIRDPASRTSLSRGVVARADGLDD